MIGDDARLHAQDANLPAAPAAVFQLVARQIRPNSKVVDGSVAGDGVQHELRTVRPDRGVGLDVRAVQEEGRQGRRACAGQAAERGAAAATFRHGLLAAYLSTT